MGKRRAYRWTAVKKVVLEKVLESAPVGDVYVGMDIGKGEIFTVLRWADGTFERPSKAKNPTEIGELVAFLQVLARDRAVTVAMESTGTYGDALRQALGDAGLCVHRVSGKAAHDYAEIFDGVPSKHDGKDAAIVAELAALGKSWPWPFEPKKGSDAVQESASATVGVRQNARDIQRIRQYASMALAAYRETRKARRKLKDLAKDNGVIQRQGQAVGVVTACVVWVSLGDPKNYHCGEAYRKAMGLNLKERSSGKHKGKLKITKRGPSIVRRWHSTAWASTKNRLKRGDCSRDARRCVRHGHRGVCWQLDDSR